MNFDESWERVKRITGWLKYGQLADFVGSTSQSISGVKKRGVFPLDWAFKIAQAHNSSTDWILTGRLGEGSAQLASGAAIVQGKSIDADEIHIGIHNGNVVHEKHSEYSDRDPLNEAFLKDWHRLSEVGMMRFWTLLKEEIEKEKGGAI